MEDVSRTAPLDTSAASPVFLSSPAEAFLNRLERLSALVGMHGFINTCFTLDAFIDAARKPMFPLTNIFADGVLTEILEKVLDRYITSDPSSFDDSSLSRMFHLPPR